MSDPLKIYKSLADETRLRLIRLLSRGPLNVNEIINIMQMGQSRVSRHLKILTEAGLVSARREGTWIYYEEHHNGDPLIADTLAHLDAHERELGFFAEDMQGLEGSIESRKEQTKAYFDGLRDPHAFLEHPSLNGEYYRRVASSLVPDRCGKLLDMGTGSGLLLPLLLEKADDLIAVDGSVTMLELARKTTGAGVARCDFRLGDLEHLPVADGEVDGVVACMVLHHVSRPADVLAEAHRVLKPGGHVAIVDLHQHNNETLRERLADLWLGFQPSQMKRWLKGAGFDLVDSKTVDPSSGDPSSGETSADSSQPGTADKKTDPLKLITFKGRKT